MMAANTELEACRDVAEQRRREVERLNRCARADRAGSSGIAERGGMANASQSGGLTLTGRKQLGCRGTIIKSG